MRRVYTVLFLLFSFRPVIADEVILQHDGLTLNAELILAEGRIIPDGVIVMLHGTLGHSGMEIMSALQTLFAENGRNSLAINLSLDVNDRHGFLPCDVQHTHTMEDASEELSVWLTWLQSIDVGKIVLLGHSRGGNQIARFIIDRKPDIAAAVLIAPSTGGDAVTESNTPVLQHASQEEWLQDVAFLHCSGATVSAESYLSYYGPATRINTPLLLRFIDIPVLVFSGTDDTVVPDLPELMKTVSRTNVLFEELEGADHFFRDLYIDDIVDTSIEFISNIDQMQD